MKDIGWNAWVSGSAEMAKPGLPAQLGLMVGPLLTMIDSSIVTVAFSTITGEFRSDLAGVQWVVSGYLLALAGGLPLTSYLARRFGAVAIYRAGLVGCRLGGTAIPRHRRQRQESAGLRPGRVWFSSPQASS
ncbi:hypothetical protein AB0K00_52450 [Dactylosporangium sp. NPDC049525]|uniref:hypothetical protein n=1 Tax=Dactylosporangium sp. NPDC049525 TaxID=3154730 RepID=UPI00343DC053